MCAFLLTEQLPGNDIGMVLHCGNQDFIAGTDMFSTEGLGDKVDAFRRSPDEYYFIV